MSFVSSNSPASDKFTKVALAVLATIVLLRLLSLSLPDLVDSTEGRYGLVAKLMLDKHDWVTPWIVIDGVEQPYDGKPPLHFWLMQLSFLSLGFNSFAARLPGVLSALGVGFALMQLARRVAGNAASYIAALVFASSTMTFFLAGSATLDMTLTLGTTLAISGFYQTARKPGSWFSNAWGYLFFVGLGIGFLVKGPISCVLPGMVIAPWLLARRVKTGSWPSQFSAIPWFTGLLVFLAIVVPWFALAEMKTPGFLKYFFINENFGRFMSKDYGDKYGSGHRQITGTAWLMMVPAVFPWALILLAWLVAARKRIFSRSCAKAISDDSELLYAILWAVCCPLLLIPARQYTATYLLPSVPGFAFLAAVLWAKRLEPVDSAREFTRTACRWLGVILILAPIIGSIIGWNWYETPTSIVALAFVVAGMFWISLRVSSSERSLPKEIARLSVCSVIVFTLACLCWNNHLSGRRSSRRVLDLASTFGKPDRELRVAFPLYYPFSVNFYGPLHSNPSLKIIHLKDDEIATSDADIFVVRDRNEAQFEKLAPGKQKLAETNHWNIYRGSGENLK